MRLDQLHDITEVRQAALANNAEMEIWFYDTAAGRIYGPSVPNDSQAIRLQKQQFLIPNVHHLHIGTRPAVLLEKMEKEVLELQGKDVRLLLFTDGDNDYAADKVRIKDAALALGQINKLSITVIGVHPENKAWWNTLVAPAFGERLKLAPPPDHAYATGQAVMPRSKE